VIVAKQGGTLAACRRSGEPCHSTGQRLDFFDDRSPPAEGGHRMGCMRAVCDANGLHGKSSNEHRRPREHRHTAGQQLGFVEHRPPPAEGRHTPGGRREGNRRCPPCVMQGKSSTDHRRQHVERSTFCCAPRDLLPLFLLPRRLAFSFPGPSSSNSLQLRQLRGDKKKKVRTGDTTDSVWEARKFLCFSL
jgi:hypothetical protein